MALLDPFVDLVNTNAYFIMATKGSTALNSSLLFAQMGLLQTFMDQLVSTAFVYT